MSTAVRIILFSFLGFISWTISGCSTLHTAEEDETIALSSSPKRPQFDSSHIKSEQEYASRLPAWYETDGKKIILVNPNVHAWGAYDSDGRLVRAGIATSGGIKCPSDTKRSSCRTGIGSFRIVSLGDEGCYSRIYPRPNGGGLMPFCMFFNGGQALHGSPDPIVIEDNVSHGCVRMRIQDAEWMRYNFAQIGTKVVVVPY